MQLCLVEREFRGQPELAPENIEQAVTEELWRICDRSSISGKRIAVGVGSRGITNYSRIVAAVVRCLLDAGATPVVLPAMGSHVEGTAEKQLAHLAKLSLTPEIFPGAEFSGDMAVETLGTWPDITVYFSAAALRTDGIIVVNRVKPHTHTSIIGSGLMKMLVIGLGKRTGAEEIHAAGYRIGGGRRSTEPLGKAIFAGADVILEKAPVIGGLAIIENALDNTAHIEGVAAKDFRSREPELLQIAADLMARLPLMSMDALLIDRISKKVSGIGADSNVTGRFTDRKLRKGFPRVKRMGLRRLAEDSEGNGFGIGLMDVARYDAIDAVIQKTTDVNVKAAGDFEYGTGEAPKLRVSSDYELMNELMKLAGKSAENVVFLFIQDTAHLQRIWCSLAAAEKLMGKPTIARISAAEEVQYDESGNFQPRFLNWTGR